MKKIVFIFLLFFFTRHFISAQDKESVLNESDYTSKNHFYFSPFHFIVGTFQMGVERDFMKSRNSISLIGNLVLSKNSNDELRFGTGGELFFKFKISRELQISSNKKNTRQSVAHHFYYLAPFFQYNYFSREHKENTYIIYQYPVNITYTDNGGKDEINSAGGGIVIGLRVSFGKKFDLDMFVGGGIKYADISVVNNIYRDDYNGAVIEPGYTGVFPKLGMKVGVGF